MKAVRHTDAGIAVVDVEEPRPLSLRDLGSAREQRGCQGTIKVVLEPA